MKIKLLFYYDHYQSLMRFVDTLLYGRESLLFSGIKDALKSKELKKNIFGSYKGNQRGDLVARSRSRERSSSSKGKPISKSKNKIIYCFHCHKEGHISKLCPKRIGKDKKRELKLIIV